MGCDSSGNYSPASSYYKLFYTDEQVGKINTVNQLGGTNLVINSESTYIWVNEKTWQVDGQKVDLIFIANGAVIPVTPCLHISSDTDVEFAEPIGYSVSLGKKGTPQNYNECFSGLNNAVTFQAFFKKTPTRIKAELVQDDTEFKNSRGETQFTIPVRY